MTNRSETVTAFVNGLEHPLKAEIVAVREIILDADERIKEQIKWNAPSFCFNGDDRVTMKLHPPRNLQLIFHRGAKVKDSNDVAFDDPSGLLTWRAADRAILTLGDMDDVTRRREALVGLVTRWMQATA